ncbi:MAG: response regulator [Pedobacter sp.]|uniref:response regulator n=1 Tax=Pedobacter sp. TaxID=1411316 RepID=UPI0035625553
MTYFFEPIGGIFNKLVIKEKDPINQARIKMLAYILVLYLLFTGILIIAYSLGGESLHLIRVCIVFTATVALIALAYYTHAWKTVSHIILWFHTLAVWSNLSIYVQDINIETLQFIWIVCALSFYMHGLKWGWFYSAINVVPVLLYTAIDNKNYFYLGTGPHEVSQFTYLFVITYNFSLIIFLQYYFFKVFNRNIISLTDTKNKLNELNEKLTLTLTDVKNLSNSRMEFLSTMSHELRTPLNGVIGISNALLLQNPRQDQEENLAVLKFSAENLLLLINDILDFNKFDSDKVQLERINFDLAALIKNNFSSLKLKAEEKMLDLDLHIDDELNGKHVNSDPTRLTQVLLNLMNNAIKFTEKGLVSLQVRIQDLTAEQMIVRFIIEDTGIGIDLNRQINIFEPFIQAATSTSRRYGGTGLGLAIVKKVLTMFKSEIHLISTPNIGTKILFDIDFKYQNFNGSASPTLINHKCDLAHLKVLVTEDNQVNILVIKKTLEQWNIIPVIAENGEIAIQKIEDETFDVILMDLYMPVMDGYEAAVTIRKMENKLKANIPIIALTASVNNNVAQKILDAGMNDYLSKPFNPEHLFKKIKDLTK